MFESRFSPPPPPLPQKNKQKQLNKTKTNNPIHVFWMWRNISYITCTRFMRWHAERKGCVLCLAHGTTPRWESRAIIMLFRNSSKMTYNAQLLFHCAWLCYITFILNILRSNIQHIVHYNDSYMKFDVFFWQWHMLAGRFKTWTMNWLDWILDLMEFMLD